jgi:hypothetical protein
VQAAMLGNTAFLSSITVQVGIVSTELEITIRNNATLPGGSQAQFKAGGTQVFVEFLPLIPGNKTFAQLPNYKEMLFTHSVLPPQTSSQAYAAGVWSRALFLTYIPISRSLETLFGEIQF